MENKVLFNKEKVWKSDSAAESVASELRRKNANAELRDKEMSKNVFIRI